MAMTETSAPAETAPDAADTPEVGGLAGMLGSGDHKVLGRIWITCALVFGLMGFTLVGITALGQVPDASFPSANAAFRISTLGRVSMLLLFILPLFIGLATYVVPLQVGARTIAFPRAAGAALWTWLLASAVMLGSFLAGGGFRAEDQRLVDLSLVAFGAVVVSLLLATICIMTTVVALRTPGMSLDRVPFFSWSMLVAGAVWLMQLGVAVANLALIYVDHHFAGAATPFGRAEAQFPQLSWVISQPAVFALAIPALGITSDIVVGLGRSRQPQRGVLLAGIGLFGAVSFGAWAQPGFIRDLPENAFFVGASVAVGLPLFLVLGGWIAALVRGKPKVAGPLALGLVSGLLLMGAALASALYVMKPLDLYGEPTTAAVGALTGAVWGQDAWQVGLAGLVVVAAALGAFAGLAWWGPKITGHVVGDGPAKLVVLTGGLGALLIAVPYFVIGFSNSSEVSGSTLKTLSYATDAGAVLVLVSILLIGFALLKSLSGPAAANDPWGGGQTLEWATASPPAQGNFAELALVESAEPLLDGAEEV